MICPDYRFEELVQLPLEELVRAVVGEKACLSRSELAKAIFLLESWMTLNSVRIAFSMTEMLSKEEIYGMYLAANSGLLEADADVTVN